MSVSNIRLRRIYDETSKGEGARVLVDRVWPRGVSKDGAEFDHWFKELEEDDKRERLDALSELAASGLVTLLYGAKDTEHNQAVVLREVLEEMIQSRQ